MKVSQDMETFVEFSFPDVNVWYRKLKIWSEWSLSYSPMHFPSCYTLGFEIIIIFGVFFKNEMIKNWFEVGINLYVNACKWIMIFLIW